MHKRTLLAAVTLATTALLGGAGVAVAHSAAHAKTAYSPADGSGHHAQPPMLVPADACIEPITTVGQILSPVMGDPCAGY